MRLDQWVTVRVSDWVPRMIPDLKELYLDWSFSYWMPQITSLFTALWRKCRLNTAKIVAMSVSLQFTEGGRSQNDFSTQLEGCDATFCVYEMVRQWEARSNESNLPHQKTSVRIRNSILKIFEMKMSANAVGGRLGIHIFRLIQFGMLSRTRILILILAHIFRLHITIELMLIRDNAEWDRIPWSSRVSQYDPIRWQRMESRQRIWITMRAIRRTTKKVTKHFWWIKIRIKIPRREMRWEHTHANVK